MKLLKKIKQKLKKYFCKNRKIIVIPMEYPIPKPMEYEPVTIKSEAVIYEDPDIMLTDVQIINMYKRELAVNIANELLKQNLVEYLVEEVPIEYHQKKIYARIKLLKKINYEQTKHLHRAR